MIQTLSLALVVLAWLSSLVPVAPWRDSYPATALGIALAADDVREAAILTAVARHESDFNAVAVGDHGASCGLFQTSCRTTPLGAPVEQAAIAILMIRQSLKQCGDLRHYVAGGSTCDRGGERAEDEYGAVARAGRPRARAPISDC